MLVQRSRIGGIPVAQQNRSPVRPVVALSGDPARVVHLPLQDGVPFLPQYPFPVGAEVFRLDHLFGRPVGIPLAGVPGIIQDQHTIFVIEPLFAYVAVFVVFPFDGAVGILQMYGHSVRAEPCLPFHLLVFIVNSLDLAVSGAGGDSFSGCIIINNPVDVPVFIVFLGIAGVSARLQDRHPVRAEILLSDDPCVLVQRPLNGSIPSLPQNRSFVSPEIGGLNHLPARLEYVLLDGVSVFAKDESPVLVQEPLFAYVPVFIVFPLNGVIRILYGHGRAVGIEPRLPDHLLIFVVYLPDLAVSAVGDDPLPVDSVINTLVDISILLIFLRNAGISALPHA